MICTLSLPSAERSTFTVVPVEMVSWALIFISDCGRATVSASATRAVSAKLTNFTIS